MNRSASPWKVVKPCTQDWEQMRGDDRRRFCEQCGKHVHNVSAMTPKERAEFAEPANQHECVTYVHRSDGTFVDLSLWARLRRMFPFLRLVRWSALAALLPAMLSGCMGVRYPRTMGAIRPVHTNQISSEPNAQVRPPVPDGVKYETTVPEKAKLTNDE